MQVNVVGLEEGELGGWVSGNDFQVSTVTVVYITVKA